VEIEEVTVVVNAVVMEVAVVETPTDAVRGVEV
jgi:hypothetical protein